MFRLFHSSHNRDRSRLFVSAVFFLFFILFFYSTSLAQAPSPSPDAQERDDWYLIKIGGKGVGYVHEELKIQPKALLTISEMRMALNRMGSRVEIRFFSRIEESAEGLLRRVDSEMTASSQTTKSVATVKDGAIELRNEAGGKTYSRTLEYSGALYGPEAIRQASLGLKKPGDSLTMQTFIAEASLIAKLSRSVIGRDVVRVDGQEIPALLAEEIYERMPIKRTVWLDKLGRLVKQEEPGPFGVVEAMRSDKATALSAVREGAELPREVYKNSIARTNVHLPRASSIDRLTLKLTHLNPGLGWPNLETDSQKVLEKTARTLLLEIRRPVPPQGGEFPVAVNEANRPYLAPNATVQSDDTEIQRLARELVGQERDAFQAALALRRWVAENMKFDLGIVFAPATEIIRDRRGTCVGYATLLASLARAAGIPSRIAMGYVYALGMFGGHAWTEIKVGEEWIPLDAAVVNEGAADAARFSFIVSSLADGLGELSLGAAQQVFGQVSVEIVEFETAGKTLLVPQGAEPFSLEGNSYENPWLGIKLGKPADFRFGKIDAVWPDPTVVELDGPGGEKIVLEQHGIYPWQSAENAVWEKLAGLVPEGKRGQNKGMEDEIFILDSADNQKSAAAVIRGAEVWIIRAEGKDAPALLRQTVQNTIIAKN